MKKIITSVMLLSLIIPAISLAEIERGENREVRMEKRFERASTTEKRLENRINNLERIRERLASTTASTSEKRIEKLNNRLQKQQEKIEKVKDRLLNKEIKLADVLGQITDKIQERINILTGKGLDLTAAKAKLAEAVAKTEEMTAETANLATLIETEITEENQVQLFTNIRTSQGKIKILARATHALLVDTIKEITKVLPKNSRATTTDNN